MRTFLVAVFISASAALAADPSAAIATAKDAIGRKEYQRASDVLHDAVREANAIADPKQRNDALSAIHFYRALALTYLNDDDGAHAELHEFFKVHPGKSTLDPRKYPARFIEMFRVENVRATSMGADATAFDQQYPGFDAIQSPEIKELPLESWGITPAFQLLATDAEREAWATLRDDEARTKYISSFWSRRDPSWKDEFERRVAFADAVFGTGTDVARGSLTDRGKVFILLGRPAHVYREPIRYNYGRFQGLNGTSERWVYFRDQLPVKPPASQVDFNFIDQPGYGDHALVRDTRVLQALGNAVVALAGK
jgi:GWxTD domain-containing protein